MTFSLAVHDPDTGQFGMVVSSSSPCVAARCLHLRAGVGAVASQNITNPALGDAVLDHLDQGSSVEDSIESALAADAHREFRQLTAVDATGATAFRSGSRTLGTHAVATREHAVVAGNLLSGEHVVESMLQGYLDADGSMQLEQRLLAAYRAAIEAGGEEGPVRSVGLSVVSEHPWRDTDLRVDDADDPAAELTRLLELWLPQKEDYTRRAIDPDSAPSYGVPGDE